MDFRIAQFFLFLYFIRPQDWLGGLIGVNVIKPLILAWIAALMVRKERSPVHKLLSTPHDWLMLGYFGYIVWNAPDSMDAFKSFLPVVIFYVFTVQSLTDWERVLAFLKTWNIMVVTVAAIGVASLYGIDITGAKDMTDQNFGRLAIGTWMCDNPNALAHTVAVAIPLSYFLFFWRGGLNGRTVYFPLCAVLVCMCMYYTESKGSFLVGGGLVVLIFVIGRPMAIKLFAISSASVLGVSALSFLPRMSRMDSLNSEEGVMGRLMAWRIARDVVDTKSTGEGWQQFVALINWEGQIIPKSTHSSYVHVGADLGLYGLFLFVAGLWTAWRTLVMVYPFTFDMDTRERCRRCGLILLCAYAVSSWMINRQYHTEYFLLIAVAASIHRLCQAEDALATAESADLMKGEEDISVDVTRCVQVEDDQCLPVVGEVEGDSAEKRPFWRRLDLIDLAASAGLTWLVLAIWDYVLETM
ncbi:O-antigen ligase family protein [Prosthecobacter sp.]|uniref:O-antigen ligase family protein n=1 Tax=Prosthecobacter sp. TaxID=1965333 RepID=UPI002487C2CF|nr:O-antigen ligase family protein [Prosthecobacter sp.]MDI1310845.1 O-antigen ligase family protein [Prosthecobacter sp.]